MAKMLWHMFDITIKTNVGSFSIFCLIKFLETDQSTAEVVINGFQVIALLIACNALR